MGFNPHNVLSIFIYLEESVRLEHLLNVERSLRFVFEMGFLCGSAGRESACNVGDLGSISGLGKSPGEGKGYSLQYSGLENSMDNPWGRKESDMTERLKLCI